jgi:SAM-dependent methyltransferase
MREEKFQHYTELALKSVYSEPEGGFHSELIPEMVKQFFLPENVPVTAYVLDIGCGQGLFMDILKDKGYCNLIGVTLSEDDLLACGNKWHSCLKSDMSDLPVPSHVVDYIWCRHALEHSPYPLFTLYEFNRVLRLGGKMYVEVPAPNCARRHEYNPNHYSIFAVDMWIALMVRAGFTVTQTNTISFELQSPSGPIPETNLIFLLEKNDSLIEERAYSPNEEICG